jgi:NADH:ubiquinone oxidoreductase subunit 3 (subunit A)
MVFSWLHLAILLFFAVGILMAGAALGSAFFLSPRARNRQMGMPYECGMVPMQDAWIRFHINYYIYALIFLAFEVDVLYLFPVAVAYGQTDGFSAFLKVFVFLFVLALAVIFFWAKGVFRWPKKI